MKIKPSRIKAITNTFDRTYNITTNERIARYLETYIDCEVTAQKLIKFYKRDHHKPIPSTLYLPNIIKASEYFSLEVTTVLIVALFPGGEGRRGKKSPRQLRNAYVHSKRQADALELLDNAEKHMAYMHKFLNAVKNIFK